MSCVFCKIADGKEPAWRIYEDEHLMVILDAFPTEEGHLLVIPKKHFVDLTEIPASVGAQMIPMISKVCKVLEKLPGVIGTNVIINNGPAAGQMGKSNYCDQVLRAQLFERVSIRELLQGRGSSTSLHRLLGELATRVARAVAGDGPALVLDDPNVLPRGRASIIAAVRARAPTARVVALVCAPRGGLAQARWALEFALAERTLLLAPEGTVAAPAPPQSQFFDESESVRYLHDWDAVSRAPTLDEGFAEIRVCQTELHMGGGPHRTPALLLELGALAVSRSDSDNSNDEVRSVRPIPHVASVVHDWATRAGPGARILVLFAEGSWMPAALAADRADPELLAVRLQHLRSQVRGLLAALANDSGVPVYYLSALYGAEREAGAFIPPSLGMIAWLQRRHRLDFSRCLYVCERVDSPLLPRAAGLPCIDAEPLFANSGWDLASKIRKYSQQDPDALPDFVRAMKIDSALPASSSHPLREHDDTHPLYSHWVRCSAAPRAVGSEIICEEHAGPGRLHGVQLPSNLSVAEELPRDQSVRRQRDDDMQTSASVTSAVSSPKVDSAKRAKQHHVLPSPPPSPPEGRPATVADVVAQHLVNREHLVEQGHQQQHQHPQQAQQSHHQQQSPHISSSPAASARTPPPKVSLRDQLQQLPPPQP